MKIMSWFILFLFGLAIGSFINVLALRYDGEHFVLNPKVIGGRSRCPHCKHTLRWFELIPLLSFIIQGGRCRKCHKAIGFKYPVVELLSAAVFIAVPWYFASYPWLLIAGWYVISAFWIAAFEILLLIAYIDIRLQIIPDELTVALAVLALFETVFVAAYLGPDHQSLFGSYAQIFGIYNNAWLSHFVGAVFGAGFLGSLVLATRGKGMGIGDVKLGAPLGFLFGWPDTLFLVVFAFMIGAVVGVIAIMLGKKTMKGALPFGPFLAAGGAVVFFFGMALMGSYLQLLGFGS
jgi:leader peptidase (prepilin peptidase)/N-methyltransferase